ncbi:MAG: PQQ-like beta-propeller repeat protein [Planctomycetes bacterium]|nr:PQQ-like beta-propeller repeat protein [Planctomycetota bacterium]
MPIVSSRPRFGRIVDAIVVTLLIVVFAGLAVYHYRRLDHKYVNPELAHELRQQSLDEPKDQTPPKKPDNDTPKKLDAKEAAAASKDWPQWRGPNRDGILLDDTPMLTTWPSGGPPLLWKKDVGEGFASVVVVRDRVFTIFQDGPSESVVAWDVRSGQEIWRHSYDCAFKNDYGNGPRSTPSVDGDHIYTVGATGIMYCLKAFTDSPKGEVVWRKDLMADFSAETPKWAVAFSPLVEGERIFIMPGGPNGNALAALDKKTGATLWSKHDDLPSYSSPIAATIHERRQVLFLTGTRLVIVDPATGDELWRFPWPVENQTNIATPIVVKNYVYVSTSYGRGCAMVKIEKSGDGFTAKLVYKSRFMKNHMSTSVRHKNHIFGFDDTILKCMDLLTGDVVRGWEVHGFDKGSLLRVNDQLIIHGANGVVALADANPEEYVERGRFQFSAQKRACWSVPVVAHGRLYVRDERKLACYDLRR